MLNASPVTDRTTWDQLVDSLGGHPMQRWGWGEVKGAGEWTPVRLAVRGPSGAGGADAGAGLSPATTGADAGRAGSVIGAVQVLLRRLPARAGWLAYVPRGPVTQPGRELDVLDAAAAYLRSKAHVVALSVEPDWDVDSPAGEAFLAGAEARGWRRSENTVFIPTTLILDLTRPLDALFADMKKKGRQYIRKGEGAGFEVRRVRTAAELAEVMDLYHRTAENAGFGLHTDEYYLTMPEKMGEDCRIWGAYRDGALHCFLWIAASGSTAFELYGGTSEVGQAEHATPMLKWAVIQECAAAGITRYDLNGLLNDGISQFKRQFAKHENELVGTWDLPMSPLYPVFTRALPLARKVLQRG